jgi:hypothetical protein
MTSSKPAISRFLDAVADMGPAVALALTLPIELLALAPFRFGYWEAAEPIVVAFHGGGALCTVVLLVVWHRDKERFFDAAFHPYVLAPAALALWSFLVAPFAKFPLLAILGPPQSGEGGLWFANLAVLVACALLVATRERQWRVITVLAVVVGFVIGGVQLGSQIVGSDVFFWTPDYIAFFALALPFISLHHTTDRWRGLRLAAMVVAVFIIVVSQNRAAQLLFVVAAGLVAVGSLSTATSMIGQVLRARVTGICIATGFAIFPHLVNYSDTAQQMVKSLWARHLGAVVLDEAGRANPLTLYVGNGWGHTQEALLVHVNAAEQGIRSIKWDLLIGDWFHSHNWIIESIYSVGIPGLILAFVVFLVMPAFCDRRTIMLAAAYAACVSATTTTWFQLSSSLPFMALAMAAVSGGSFPPPALRRVVAPGAALVPVILAALVAVQAAAAIALLSFGLRTSAALTAYRNPPSAIAEYRFPADFRGAEFAFAKAVRERIVVLAEAELMADGPDIETHRAVVRGIFADLEERIESGESPFLIFAGISAFSQIMHFPALSWLRPDYESKTDLWAGWLAKFLRLAPRRTDAGILYFAWLLKKGQKDELARICREILKNHPDDPVALYHLGASIALDRRPETRSLALAYMRRGIENGVERFLSVKPELKNLVLQGK